MIRYAIKGQIAETVTNLRIEKGATVWLTSDDSDGGWYQWGGGAFGVASAALFDTVEEALEEAKDCPGPWFNMPDPKSLTVVKVDYTPPQAAKTVILEQVRCDQIPRQV